MSYRMLVLAKKIVSEMKDFYQVNEPIKVEKSDIETIEWLIEQAEKAEKYREALEFYANEKSWMNREITILMDGEPTDVEDCPAIFDDGGNIARQALEESK